MNNIYKTPIQHRLKSFFIGKARNIKDEKIFQHMTLVAFFAWIGLGSDGLSSSCYGPEETYRTLGTHTSLAILVALAIAFTIFIISVSYSQIIKLFPSGGGGYKVATKLLSPRLGMISGSSLIVDYVLTIALSVASGTDAIFSLMPAHYQTYKIMVSFAGIIALILLNMRGIKESVFTLTPIFVLFILTHVFVILYAWISHLGHVAEVYNSTLQNFHETRQSLGVFGMLALSLRAYSMGAGTYTGLEAVSNSIPILKDPKVKTGLTTMRYMAFSLAITVFGLLIAYMLFGATPQEGKTLNAILLQKITISWSPVWGISFVFITLASEAALLFIAAQTGFLDGPRVISSMAQDSWFPRKFIVLSDRLVTQNGILFMGTLAIIILLLTKGAVRVLVVLYSINVFITFSLSQAGMVRHWWLERKTERNWMGKLFINGIGLVLTLFILISLSIIKFREGGWVTILITLSLILTISSIRKHYMRSDRQINRLNLRMFHYVDALLANTPEVKKNLPLVRENKTAVICVNSYNGLGIQTFLKVIHEFNEYRNIVFMQVGIVDSGNFKGNSELDNLQKKVTDDLKRYQKLSESLGYPTLCYQAIGTDVADEIKEMSKIISARYTHSVFFIGMLIQPKATAFRRILHNQTQYAIQNRLAHKGLIIVMVPVRTHQNI